MENNEKHLTSNNNKENFGMFADKIRNDIKN
jgi:hypothetical protein